MEIFNQKDRSKNGSIKKSGTLKVILAVYVTYLGQSKNT